MTETLRSELSQAWCRGKEFRCFGGYLYSSGWADVTPVPFISHPYYVQTLC